MNWHTGSQFGYRPRLFFYGNYEQCVRASELDNIPKHLKDFGSKKGTSFGGGLSPTIYAELVQAMQ